MAADALCQVSCLLLPGDLSLHLDELVGLSQSGLGKKLVRKARGTQGKDLGLK